MKDEKLLTTKEVAKLLEIKTATVLKYAQEGKITPVNSDPYQIDSTKLFREEEILQFKKDNRKPGVTTGEAAKRLGVHPQTIKTYINNGKLKAEKHLYRGRDIYFISEEDFKEFSLSYKEFKNKEMKEFFIKDEQDIIALFQLYRNTNTNEYARVMELQKDKNGYFKTNHGQIIHLDEEEANEFLPIYIIQETPHILKKGYVIFEFTPSENIMDPTYKIIDLFYQHLGPRNMKLVVTNEKIHVEVKPISLQLETQYYQEELDLLKNSLVEGKIGNSPKVILLESDVVPINVTLPLTLKKKIQKDAAKLGISMDEFVLSIIKDKYGKEGE